MRNTIFDITLNNVGAMQGLDYMKSTMSHEKKCIILLFKDLLNRSELYGNVRNTGGLSSFSIFLMVDRFLMHQNHTQCNNSSIEYIFNDFLMFYKALFNGQFNLSDIFICIKVMVKSGIVVNEWKSLNIMNPLIGQEGLNVAHETDYYKISEFFKNITPFSANSSTSDRNGHSHNRSD